MQVIAKPPVNAMKNKKHERPPVHPSEEVLKNALAYSKGDELAATTWMNKYALRNSDG